MPDKEIKCAGCGKSFTFTASEQQFFQGRGMSEPKRCKDCRQARQPQRGGSGGSESEAKKNARKLLFGQPAEREGGKKAKRED